MCIPHVLWVLNLPFLYLYNIGKGYHWVHENYCEQYNPYWSRWVGNNIKFTNDGSLIVSLVPHWANIPQSYMKS